MKRKYHSAIGLLVLSMFLIVALGSEVQAEKVWRVGISTTSLRTDWSWGQDVYQAFKYIEKNYPNVKVTFTDALKLEEIRTVAQDWADQGYDLIVGYGYEFLDDYVEVSKAHPNSWFLISCAPHMASDKYPKNLVSVYYLEEEAGYLLGSLAALLSKTNKVGVLGALEIPCTVKGMNGFRKGAYDVKPDINVMYTYIGSYTDPAGEREATESMIDAGADSIWEFWLSLGVGEAAQARKVNYFGSHYSRMQLPGFSLADFVGSCMPIVDVMEMMMEGTLKGTTYYVGVESGYTGVVVETERLPGDVLKELSAIQTKVASGEIQVPKFMRTMPATWPRQAVTNVEQYREPYFGEFTNLIAASPRLRDKKGK